MRGRRVGEVAAREVDRLIEQHLSILLTDVLVFTHGLTSDTREFIMRDFEYAQKHIAYVIRLKLSSYQNNPHRVLGLAHPDVSVAKRCCREVLDLAQAQGPVDAHPWIKTLVFAGGALHTEFLRFVKSGVCLDELRCLALFRARLRLIPLVETWVESRHNGIKAEGKTRYRISPSRVSLRLRGLEIERAIEAGPDFVQILASHCLNLRSMSSLL